jgi:adenine-specific DNA-methyltransferase
LSIESDSTQPSKKVDLGFKVFKLQPSNFKIWRADKIKTDEDLEKELELHIDPIIPDAKTEDILYELLLKSGEELTAKIEKKDGIYFVNDKEIAIILEKIDEDLVKEVIAAKPQKLITLDKLFSGNDQLKTNTVLQMKDAEIDFKVV